MRLDEMRLDLVKGLLITLYTFHQFRDIVSSV